jgi:hypothetical protein
LQYRRIAASPYFPFMCVLGPLLFRSSLYQLSARLDEISLPLAAQSEPFFGLFGPPPDRPRGPLPPSNCAKFAGAGAFPRLRPPPPAPRAARAQPEAQTKAPCRNSVRASWIGLIFRLLCWETWREEEKRHRRGGGTRRGRGNYPIKMGA